MKTYTPIHPDEAQPTCWFHEAQGLPEWVHFVHPRAHRCEGDSVAVYKRKE